MRRTPPTQKWLLNERAVIAGELQAIEAELVRLAERRGYLLQMLDALDNVYSQVTYAAPASPEIVVHGRTRYGGMGNLLSWVREMLRAAYPQALDTAVLTLAAEDAFGLVHTTHEQRRTFRNNSLRTALRNLLARGEAERLHNFEGALCGAGVWRWVPPEPSFQEVVAAKEAVQKLAQGAAESVSDREPPWL